MDIFFLCKFFLPISFFGESRIVRLHKKQKAE